MFKAIQEEETYIPKPKNQLKKEEKSLLSGQNVRNVVANIKLIRYTSTPRKNVTNVTRRDTFFDSMTATLLLIRDRLYKDPALQPAQILKKNVSCIIQIVANKMFETSVT